MKQKKILILGAKGMLGQDLADILANRNHCATCPPKRSEGGANFDLSLWDKEELDITNQDQVNLAIRELKPNIIINCAAYTDVDGCETNQELANRVNGLSVGYLAAAARIIDAVMLHISTDYIFTGQNSAGYTEDSQEIGPLNVYGRSKLLGEQLLQKNTDQYYLLRTSWLYGKNGKNFVETMLQLGREKNQFKVINDQLGKPTYTVDLAQQILYILNNDLPYGIYHVTNETKKGGITWYDFAGKIFELAGLKLDLQPCKTEEFLRPAKRPAYSALLNTKLSKVRNWQQALAEYINDWRKT